MDFLLLANVTVGVLLAISGVAKLRDRAATADAFRALRLPAWLSSAQAPMALPWAELVLAALLIFARGWLLVAAAVAALLLMLTYTAVIARALGFDEPVRCGCFGALGAGDVDRRTLVRNILLSALAALGLVGAILRVSMYSQPATAWGWVAVAALAAAAVALSLGGGGASATAASGPKGWLAGATLTPVADGPDVRIADLARQHKGATLLFLLPGCGSCGQLMGELPRLREQNPGRFIVPVLPHWAASDSYAGVPNLHRDPGSNLAAALGMQFAPAALEVGADGGGEGELIVGGADVLTLLGDEVKVEPEPEPEPEEPQELDYVRRPIPNAVLLDDGGAPHTLYEMVAERPQLLISIDCLCASARTAVEQLARWQERLPILDVRLVTQFRPQEGALTPEQERMAFYDHVGLASRSLRLQGQVSAVLLGADGMLAGGPVEGVDEVTAFVDDIAEEIAEALSV